MQARAAELGGTCHIASDADGGTRVSVRLPCPPDAGPATTV
jgi:signal transduction histidine kinase